MKSILIKVLNENNFHNAPLDRIDFMAEEVTNRTLDRQSQAMFLSHVLHETAGLAILEEDCSNPNAYSIGKRYGNKSYHGRGFLHLSHPANYLSASEALGYGDELWRRPENVSRDLNIAMDTSAWYWNTRVVKNGLPSKYRSTTIAINGGLEDGESGASLRRYKYYCDFAREMGMDPLPL